MTIPHRIQRRRVKGWRAPEGAIYVGRGSKWGNPWTVIRSHIVDTDGERKVRFESHEEALRHAVSWYGEAIPNGWEGVPTLDEIRAELAGHDLMCWCPLDMPCHADVLLELANRSDA